MLLLLSPKTLLNAAGERTVFLIVGAVSRCVLFVHKAHLFSAY